MAVIFDLYLFTTKYIEKVKEDEKQRKDHSRRLDEGEVEYEIGTIACRNSLRTQPIFFYNVDELMGLIEAAYAVSNQSQAEEQRLGRDFFPDEAANLTIIELDTDDPFAGRFIEPDGGVAEFSSRDELKEDLEKYVPEI